MPTLLSLENLSLAYGLAPLLNQVNFHLESHERIGLIGRNGAGKSSFLKILEGTVQADSGRIIRASGLTVARLHQELPHQSDCSVYQMVAEGLAQTGQLLAEYHDLAQHLSDDPADLQRLESLHHRIDACQGWHFDQDIKQILQRLDLPADRKVAELSGGWQRRVALAKALILKPDVLLLDEPTNHLDIEAITWLEQQLLDYPGSLVFITHDRSLLTRLATRIVELDRGQLYSWPGDYDNFLRRKEEALAAEQKSHHEFDKKLEQEERWIRQGIKARRTRNEGRVRALKQLRQQRQERRTLENSASFAINTAQASGQCVIDAKNVCYAFESDKPLVNHFSIRIQRGDRLGLIGPNGVGKSTLLNLLLGKLTPQEGTVDHGTQLQIAYFDQLRERLDPTKSILDNVAEGRSSVMINGQEKHITSYLKEFLFHPARLQTPVSALSGGECNRLLLARLFTLPANVLVLDEPTNDLDIETLELLEELLAQYTGTLILVSHDRTFLDHIVTSSLIFEGNGQIQEFFGGYSDWQNYRQRQKTISPEPIAAQATRPKTVKKATKLSYKQQKALEELPRQIEALESEQARLSERMSEPSFYQQPAPDINHATNELRRLEQAIEDCYQQWQALTELEAQLA